MPNTNAPFTPDQVRSIHQYQKSDAANRIICTSHGADSMIVREDGMVCAKCSFRLNVVPTWMTDWSWKNVAEDMRQ